MPLGFGIGSLTVIPFSRLRSAMPVLGAIYEFAQFYKIALRII